MSIQSCTWAANILAENDQALKALEMMNVLHMTPRLLENLLRKVIFFLISKQLKTLDIKPRINPHRSSQV